LGRPAGEAVLLAVEVFPANAQAVDLVVKLGGSAEEVDGAGLGVLELCLEVRSLEFAGRSELAGSLVAILQLGAALLELAELDFALGPLAQGGLDLGLKLLAAPKGREDLLVEFL